MHRVCIVFVSLRLEMADAHDEKAAAAVKAEAVKAEAVEAEAVKAVKVEAVKAEAVKAADPA